MKMNKIKSIYKKEMLDLLRDKKTLIMMVLVPLLLYPLIMIAAFLVTTAVTNNIQSGSYTVAIEEEEGVSYDRAALISLIEAADEDQSYTLEIIECDDPAVSLQEEELDTYLTIGTNSNPGTAHTEESKLTIQVHYLSSVTNSSAASDMLMDKLKLYRQQLSKNELAQLGLDAEYLMEPIELKWNNCASKEESVGNLLGKILPFLLIVSILMGALYPAIDTTTGEKERGTLETLLTLPVRNEELIMGKFLAVATVSVISALLNLVSMAFMGIFLSEMVSVSTEDALSIDLASFIPAIIIVILCVIAFALFISAITMCVTTFAKSFKEANNYTTPLLLVVMLTGYIGFIPNIEFTPLMAAIPVVNICLLIGNLLVFKYSLSLILIVLVSNIAYAVLAVMALGKIYNSEEVLFGESGVSLQMFTSRRHLKKGGTPNFSDAVLVTAVSLLLLLYAGTILQLKFPFMGVFFTQLLIISVPVFAAWYTKKDFKQTFSLNLPRPAGILGALLLEVGTFLSVTLLSVGLTRLWPQDAAGINADFMQMLEGIGFIPALLVIALAPAICEEALFRGYFLAAARKKFKPRTAILLVAAMFGIYHMNLIKFFTTGILGIALCYAVYKSGSIVLSCLMHFINNAFSVTLLFYGEEMEQLLPILTQETMSLSELLILIGISLVCIGLGVFLIKGKPIDRNMESSQ